MAKTTKNNSALKILYITRKFPPTVGGMETAAYELHRALQNNNQVYLVKWGGANKYLPVIYPWLFLKGLFLGWLKRPDAIYLQDGVLAPMGASLRFLTGRPTILTLHGLDVTYRSKIFQTGFRLFAKHNTKLVAVSQATKEEVMARTGRSDTEIINNGVNDEFYLDLPKPKLISELATEINVSAGQLKESKLLLTSGRLVKRKGVTWFAGNALPDLIKQVPNILYLISGDGPEREALERIIAKQNLGNHVKVLGFVSDQTRKLLYNTADLFIMPNVPVATDPEGFGIVAIEASSCGTPVVAAALGGITDAVRPGGNGYLAETQDSDEFVNIISGELNKPKLSRAKVRGFTLNNYSWAKAANGYTDIIKQIKRAGK